MEIKVQLNLALNLKLVLPFYDLSLAQLVSQFSGQPVSKILLNASFRSPQVHGNQIIDPLSFPIPQRIAKAIKKKKK